MDAFDELDVLFEGAWGHGPYQSDDAYDFDARVQDEIERLYYRRLLDCGRDGNKVWATIGSFIALFTSLKNGITTMGSYIHNKELKDTIISCLDYLDEDEKWKKEWRSPEKINAELAKAKNDINVLFECIEKGTELPPNFGKSEGLLDTLSKELEESYDGVYKNMFLTESERNDGIALYEALSIKDFESVVKRCAEAIKRGYSKYAVITAAVTIFGLTLAEKTAIDNALSKMHATLQQAREERLRVSAEADWKVVSTDAVATVYNLTKSQCNNDLAHTASMFRLDTENPYSHRIVAMERTYMKELGLKYGDLIKIEGTDSVYDGVWQVQDTMNKRFRGQHKIDLLVPNGVKHGKWDNVSISVLKHPIEFSDYFRKNLAPQKPKQKKRR